MKCALEIITPPQYEPVSLNEAKSWLRIFATDTNHDSTVRLLVAAMRRDAENRTFRAFIPRTLRLNLEVWPVSSCGNMIELPFPPCVSVSSITYLDLDGVRRELDASQWELHSEYEPAYIVPAYGVSWPSLRKWPGSVQVTYQAGYAPGSPGTEESDYQAVMPENLRLWMETKIATLFENREQIIVGTIVNTIAHPFTDGLLDPLIVGTRMF